jgi:hypothetical protein
MWLIGLVVLLAFNINLAPRAAEAQEQGKVYRVGRLSVAGVGSASTEALKRGLRELGWAVDENLLIEIRDAEGDTKRLPALAAARTSSTRSSRAPNPLIFPSSDPPSSRWSSISRPRRRSVSRSRNRRCCEPIK